MTIPKNIYYYLTTILLFLVLKFGYTIADTNDLFFLLRPTDTLVGLLISSKSVYFADKGFYYDDLNFIINKSCSGFNFLLLCFSMFAIVAFKNINLIKQRIVIIPAALLLAYVVTIFVNASRIFVSIVLQNQVTHFLSQKSIEIVHETIGIVTNLFFLILIYILLERLLKKQNYL
ncbi:exosortase K [Flavobacterium succinicans]|uniref:Transmembrane exosortase EpsH n=1 Tax=Flavobacterium succinicans TaxID=29536 RepID=A0A199XTF5_9FLAO|nr:exosortase K [Flavobacterium succinicans]OAZ04614.1 transmembrane exosortase EpsH [Flavobacterium succinicans]